jgi:hypothetical protein
MDLRELTYLFYGHGCEYVLHPLFEEMNSLGYNCVEVDTLTKDFEELLPSLKEKKLVFLTSAHFLLDHENFTHFYETNHKIYSPLELLSILHPTLSVFMPHDLSSPVSNDEFLYLSLFDLCLLPWEGLYFLRNYVDCLVTGWPKAGICAKNISNSKVSDFVNMKNAEDNVSAGEPSYQAVWFVSNITNHLERGFDHFLNWMSPLTSQNVAVKLPQWTNIEDVEAKLIKAGVTVIPSYTNIFKVMNHTSVVITNGTSSIVTESRLYGKKTINIRSDCELTDSRILFRNLPDIYFVDSIKDLDLNEFCQNSKEQKYCTPLLSKLQPFSMKSFLEGLEKKMLNRISGQLSEKEGI